jgi:hypothetical protein
MAVGTTIAIATGAVGLTAKVSPALPMGHTLSVTAAGQVVITAASSAPAVDAYGPWTIEVSG